MKDKEIKTNAIRILESNKISHKSYQYECKEFTDGLQTAKMLGLPPERMYKTLVTEGKSKNFYVFVIPIEQELDLKKAAAAANEKSVEMIPVKNITLVTGYIRGGCTAIGMKKNYPTFLDTSAGAFSEIIVSAGKLGAQIELAPADYLRVVNGTLADLTRV